MKRPAPLGDDERDALDREREFLLRSLDDLDRERDAGNIDDATYDELHADYTARAAAVLRRLDGEGVATPTPDEPASRRLLTLGAIALIAIVAVAFVAVSVRQRQPGGSLTGNAPRQTSVNPQQQRAALAAAVKRAPKDYSARIAYARSLLGASDYKNAIQQFDTAATLDPKQPEPLTYGGWLRALVALQIPSGSDRDLLVESAMQKFDAAIAAAPTYADTYVFRGLVHFRLGDAKAAVPDFQRFLQLAPDDHPMRQTVLATLQQAMQAAGIEDAPATAPTSTTTP
jgi:tetratricopeptide (TPR) repeat protein